ncbi:MAG: hypothetical protein JKY37_20970 [Nannocystaceae bacterium]|nr:hypothetical protein [Nannocystaceae bacterium]
MKSYCPQNFGAKDRREVPYVDVTGTAQLVSDKWGYIFSDSRLFLEVFVAEDGLVSLINVNGLTGPIPARPNPAENVLPIQFFLKWLNLDSKHHYVRIFLSRVRLTKASINKLLARWTLVRDTIPPLWSWHDLQATVLPSTREEIRSSSTFFAEDGRFALFNPRTTLRDPKAGSVRVFVGWDPFTIAEARSNVYVRRLNQLKAERDANRAGVQRNAFGRVLIDTIGSRERLDEMGLAGVDLINQVNAFEKRERGLLRSIGEAAAAVCGILDGKLCRICIDSAMRLEGVPEDAVESEPLKRFYATFDTCTRDLGASPTGSALLRKWATESESDRDHFINTAFFPSRPTGGQQFRTFRWASRSIVSFLSQCMGHKIAAMQSVHRGHLADAVKLSIVPLVKQLTDKEWTLWNKIRANPGKFFEDVDLNEIMPAWKISEEASMTFKIGFRDPIKVRTRFFQGIHDEMMMSWLADGNASVFADSKRWLGNIDGALKLLDVVNLALTLVALKDKSGKDPAWKTLTSTAAVATGVLATIIEHGASTSILYNGKDGLKSLKITDAAAKRLAVVLRVVVSLVYAFLNTYDALVAIKNGEYGKAVALGVATFGEILSAAGSLLVLFSVRGAVVGVWIGVIGGLIAAGGYIAASLLSKTPLQQILARCEWGTQPYAVGGPIHMSAFKGDYQKQLDLFFRFLCTVSGVRRHAILDQQGVALRVAFVPSGAYLRTKWYAEFRKSAGDDVVDGARSQELLLSHEQTKKLLKGSLEKSNVLNSFGPPSQWFETEEHGYPVRLTFTAVLRGEGDVPISELRFDLTNNGATQAARVHHSGIE